MDRAWVEEQDAEYKAGYVKARTALMEYIRNCPAFDEKKRSRLESEISILERTGDIELYYRCMYDLKPGFLGVATEDDDPIDIAAVEMYHDMDVEALFERVGAGPDAKSGASRYLDSDPHHFHGDVVITDPCYFGLGDYEQLDDMLDDFIQRDTLYGDWSCHVYDMNTKQELGQFCADGAQVCVADLDEVNEHNARWLEQFPSTFPEFGCTVIRDFDGNAWFEVREEEYTDYTGKPAVDYAVVVCGNGRNFITGEEIIFESRQTGL